MVGGGRIRRRQSHARQRLAVRQLGNQGLLQQGLLRAGFAQRAIHQHAGVSDKIRDLVEAVKHQHEGDALGTELTQQIRQLGARGNVQPVKRLVQNQ